jgi:hypothetical protein
MRAAASVERLGLYASTIIGPNRYFSNALQNKRFHRLKNKTPPGRAAFDLEPVSSETAGGMA